MPTSRCGRGECQISAVQRSDLGSEAFPRAVVVDDVVRSRKSGVARGLGGEDAEDAVELPQGSLVVAGPDQLIGQIRRDVAPAVHDHLYRAEQLSCGPFLGQERRRAIAEGTYGELLVVPSNIRHTFASDHRSAIAGSDPAVRKRLTSVGKPIATVEVEIRDESGEAVGVNQAGEIFVRGGQVAGEYLGMGTMLDANGWFPTRDRGYLDQYGYLYLDGRADDVIVRGGENISPGEVEDVLLEHPAVLDVAIVAIPDEQWGENVGAAVVLKDGANASVSELQDWVKDRLRSSRVPASIVFKAQLPYNEMGKILRRVVKQELSSPPAR